MPRPAEELDRQAAEMRLALAGLRADLEHFRGRLRLSPDPGASRAGAEEQTLKPPPPGGGEPVGRAAEGDATGAGEPSVLDEPRVAASSGPLRAKIPDAGPQRGSGVSERLSSKSDAELGRTYELAISLLSDAEERNDSSATSYWRSLVAVSVEEAARRPDFGAEHAGSGLRPRRRRRLIGGLQNARQIYLDRLS